MEMLEKVERLREKADVSYEEARAALEEANGDLLDAMVLLERQGKVRRPQQATYSTEYEEQKEYVRVRDKVEEQKESAPSFRRSIRRIFTMIVRFVKQTAFVVKRNEEVIFTMPTFVFVLLLLFFWEVAAPVMLIALFFGMRYSFEGGEDTSTANAVLDKAGDFAEDIKNEFRRKDREPGPEDDLQ